MKIMITGHRPNRLGGYNENNPIAINIKNTLVLKIAELQSVHSDLEFITGLAQGVDTWFADIGIDNDIPIHAYLPFTGQQSKWPMPAQDRYLKLLKKCKSSNFISPKASRQAYLDRNDAMVNACDMAIAVWDGSPSGTGYTVRKLQQTGKKVIIIHPDNL
jgi:uncharacterized phage-like protein YoqJ